MTHAHKMPGRGLEHATRHSREDAPTPDYHKVLAVNKLLTKCMAPDGSPPRGMLRNTNS